jgi:hypothetical protein
MLTLMLRLSRHAVRWFGFYQHALGTTVAKGPPKGTVTQPVKLSMLCCCDQQRPGCHGHDNKETARVLACYNLSSFIYSRAKLLNTFNEQF